MLAHSPHLPLIIDAVDNFRDISAEDEERITFVLQRSDRMRCIRFRMPVPNLQKLIFAMDKEFPILEYLYIAPLTKHDTTIVLPQTFQAPQLRQLILINFATPIGSPLIVTTLGLITLALDYIHPSAYFSLHFIKNFYNSFSLKESDLHAVIIGLKSREQLDYIIVFSSLNHT
jgi:hypothetical protein